MHLAYYGATIGSVRGSVTERGPGVWRLRVFVGRTENGTPRQVSKTVRTKKRGGKKEALAALSEFYEEVEAAGIKVGSQKTVGMMLTAYLERCRRLGRKQSTLESYEMVVKRVPAALKAMPLSQVGSEELDAFYGALGLKDSTIEHTHAFLRAAFAQAVKWKWVLSNPADDATPTGEHRAEERKPMDLKDIKRMVALAQASKEDGGEEDVVLAAAITIAALAGARRGELCGLQWDDLDTQAGTLKIERQWVPGKGGQYLTETKSAGGKRVVYLGAEGIAFMERYRARMGDLWEREPDGWLLSNDGASPLRAKGLGAAISALADKLDLKVTTHSFRRAAATQLHAAGVDVDSASRRMGHTKEVMLGSYVLGADDRQQAAGDLIEDRFAAMGLPLAELLPSPSKETE